MKGLPTIPSTGDLERAYDSLLHQTRTPTAEEIARYSQWCRFDPRLGEIWVGYIRANWKTTNPIPLRSAIFKEPWPAAMGPLLDFVGMALERSQYLVFRHWKDFLTAGMSPAQGEQFFLGLRRFASEAMLEDALFSLETYAKWGFFSRENLLPKSRGGMLAPQTRKRILEALIRQKPRLRVRDYWNEIGRCISLRQAERDLDQHPRLKSSGRTKGKSYFWK